MIRFKCNNCNHQIEAPQKFAGKRVRCPKCKAPICVPQSVGKTGTQESELIKFRCPSCNQKMRITPDYAGKRVRCAKCKNPLCVPQASSQSGPPATKDPTAVLRAGQEQQPKKENIWDDMENMDGLLMAEAKELLQMEQLSQTVEQPPEQVRVDLESNASEPTDSKRGIYNRDNFNTTERWYKQPKRVFCRLIIAAGYMMFISLGMIFLFGYRVQSSGIGDFPHIKAFGLQYIDLLLNEDIETSKEFLSSKLRDKVTDRQIGEMAEWLSQCETLDLKKQFGYLNKETEESCFILRYDGSASNGKKVFFLFITEVDDKLEIEAVRSLDNYTERLAFGLSPSDVDKITDDDKIQQLGMNKALLPAMRFFVFLLFAPMLLLGFLTFFSMFIVYRKAGEPAWAVVVPLYNMWVLAEIGGKPGWLGLLFYLSNIQVPFGGLLVNLSRLLLTLILWAVISIGVARAFDRGIGFGIGLTLAPIVFYPLLAFSSD